MLEKNSDSEVHVEKIEQRPMASIAFGLERIGLVALQALPNHAAAQGAAALTGIVTSAQEGAMEGVVVSARKAGSIVQVSVTTDAKGRYAFPENRLEPGHYMLAARAVGYDLAAPSAARSGSSRPRAAAGLRY